MGYLKQKKIKVSKQTLEELAARWGCTKTKVYNALAYRSNSESSEKIRQEALNNYGGKEVTEFKVVEDFGSAGQNFKRGC